MKYYERADTKERVERGRRVWTRFKDIQVDQNEIERQADVNTNVEFSRTLHLKFREAAVFLLSEYKCKVFPLLQLLVSGQLLSKMLHIICLVNVKNFTRLFDLFASYTELPSVMSCRRFCNSSVDSVVWN